MIENFSGIDTERVGRHDGFCHRRHAVIILFFLKDRSRGMGQSSMFHTFRTIYM